MKLRINSINYRGSIVDGPGIRTVLFVQGCKQRCESCHNPSTWEIDAGISISVIELAADIRNKSKNKKLTISGGEPLLQVPAVLELIKLLHDFNIVLYTGYDFKDVPSELLFHLDYIKVGKYEKDKHCTTIDYIGSKNQQFIHVERLKNERCKGNSV